MIFPIPEVELDYHARMLCGLCGKSVNLVDVKGKNETWFRVVMTGKYLCPLCHIKLFDQN